MRKTVWISCAVALLALSGLIAWSTRHMYKTVNHGKGSSLVRIDRITGATAILENKTWAPVAAAPETTPTDQILPDDAMKQLAGTAEFDGSELVCKLYNGSAWRLDYVFVRVAVHERKSGKQVLQRDFRVRAAHAVAPFTSAVFRVQTFISLQPDQTVDWKLIAATGRVAIEATEAGFVFK